jgi:hypothetical protein
VSLLIRKRDHAATQVAEAPIKEADSRIDEVLKRLDAINNRPEPQQMTIPETESLTAEIAALRESRERPWEFKIRRDTEGKIKEVTAKQVRTRLI